MVQNHQKQITSTKQKTIQEEGQSRLPLTSDYVFKRVFAKDENNSMLKDFLEAILDRKINKVVVKNPEIPKNMLDERLGVLDLKLDVDDNEVIDVEMQMQNEHNIKERSGVYLSKIVAEQLKTKQPYTDIKKGITINLLNFEYFRRNSYHSVSRMRFEETTEREYVDLGYEKEEEIATDIFEMHFIELPKFIKKNPTCKTKLEQWLWLLVGDKEEMVQMAMEENEEVKKTVEVLDELSLSEEERQLYEYRQKALLDEIDRIDYMSKKRFREGEEQGLKQGEKNGKRQEKIEIAKNLLKKNISLEIISEATGLTEEEIKELK